MIRFITVLLPALLILFSCQKKTEILVQGSETMHPMMNQLGKGYAQKTGNVEVRVLGGGSAQGIRGLIDKKIDIALSSRKLFPEEVQTLQQAGNLEEVVIGYDGIAIVVNPNNPVQRLTLDQISKIFSGEIVNWKDLGGKDIPIQPVIRNDKSGTAHYFGEHILKRLDLGLAEFKKNQLREYTTSAKVVKDNHEMGKIIQADEGAIGYMGMGSAHFENEELVKTLDYSVTGVDPYVEPNVEDVMKGKYKLSRGLYMVHIDSGNETVEDFVTFVTGEEGQKIVLASGYLRSSLPAVEVEAERSK